jgi:hypothetical protein
MHWELVAVAVAGLWAAWEFRRLRRVLEGVRRVPVPLTGSAPLAPTGFRGAVPPNRFVVVKWPGEIYLYQGCLGAMARNAYVNNHPIAGERIELWENGDCRGSKG